MRILILIFIVHSITLNWTWSGVVKLTNFSIQKGPSASGPFHQISTVPKTILKYVDKPVIIRPQPYCYQIIANTNNGKFSSNIQCAIVK